jgi:hypothetical protein
MGPCSRNKLGFPGVGQTLQKVAQALAKTHFSKLQNPDGVLRRINENLQIRL